jgi:subtilisin family serine protease
VKVGVLSDSYNCLGGASADVGSGDLPAGVTVVQEMSGCGSGTDEGRAMLQIVHDVAPGASLSFASAFNGMASFAANIVKLKNAGAKVIVDDVIYFAEPMFQDGIIAQAVDNVVADGAAYFSSAGNSARSAYQSAFRNSGTNLGSNGTNAIPDTPIFFAHDFDPGPGVDLFQTVTLPSGTTCFSFQWADRYFSVSGNPGAQTNLDVAVFINGSFIDGLFTNNIGKDPVEVGCIPISGSVQIAIGKFDGADPSLIKYVAFRSDFVANEFSTNSGTIFGHANALGAEAVGAAFYDDTPAFGVSPPVLETFSSAGTTPILFDLDGNPTNDPRSNKPEIVAPDGADTTFFGSDVEPNGFPNFFGTSAAAPHAAGVAALLFEANPTLTPAQIYSALESTAVNMGPAGFDTNSGFGLIRADEALAAIPAASPPETNITSNPVALSNSARATFTFTSTVAGSTFECSLDGGPFAPCKTPKKYSKLANGAHTFEVAAIDPNDIKDPTPANFNWTVDTARPDTTISSSPPVLTNGVNATFEFGSNEPGSTFQCKLDKDVYTPCTSPQTYNGLAAGKHTFLVAATDPAGNLDKKAAAHKWSIDTTAPETIIKTKTKSLTTSTSATFSFSAKGKGNTFACDFDGSGFSSCTSPQTFNGLSLGGHVFQVRATDPAGNTDLTPASFNWTIQ